MPPVPDAPAELQWVVAKALEKEPDRRYASVAELDAELDRLLSGRPVLAGETDTAYRVRKFVSRHRRSVSTRIRS